ncbi:MAG TPA: hypothetical protein VH877_23145 [Polyangia bacterium]|nr:hypothetical protein [Polyangia bacterium]
MRKDFWWVPVLFVLGGVLPGLGGCDKRPAATEGAPAPAGATPARTAPTATPPPATDPNQPPPWAADLGPGERGPRGKWLSIVYMGNGQGEIEPCG